MPTLHFHSLAEPPPVVAWAGPPRWLLATLLALVLLAHALALKSVWSGAVRFGAVPALEGVQAAQNRAPIQVRQIQSTTAAAAATALPALPPAPEAAQTPEKPPFLEPKEPPAQGLPAQAAINSGADNPPLAARQPSETQAPEDEGEGEFVMEEIRATNAPFGLASADSPSALGQQSALLPTQAEATAAAAGSSAAASSPLATTATTVTAMALPASARLAYQVEGQAKGLTYFATADFDWKSDGATYVARMTVKAFLIGQRSMQSQGAVSAQGLAPLKFTDQYRSEQAAHFEADKGLITFSANTPSKPWQPGAQDRVSVFMQLAGMLAGTQAAAALSNTPAAGATVPGTIITLYTAGPRDADFWSFSVEAPETLLLPYGPITALRLVRQPRREYDQKVEIWYAPSLGFLPVRSRITQANGDFVDQKLSSLVRGS